MLGHRLIDRELDGVTSGFGHLIYTGPDPRADLLDATLATSPDLKEPVRDLIVAVLRESGRHPNVDLVARLAGLPAHALEERSLLVLSPVEVPLRCRPRGLYTG